MTGRVSDRDAESNDYAYAYYDTFLASDALIKQIPRLLVTSFNKVRIL